MLLAPRPMSSLRQCFPKGTRWPARRESSLNWLALGLLLAAWNSAGDDAAHVPDHTAVRPRRPEVLRGYTHVSVRALKRAQKIKSSIETVHGSGDTFNGT